MKKLWTGKDFDTTWQTEETQDMMHNVWNVSLLVSAYWFKQTYMRTGHSHLSLKETA